MMYESHSGVGTCAKDVQLRLRVNIGISANGTELQELFPHIGSSHVVPVEDTRHSGMRQDERIAPERLVVVAEAAPDDGQLIGVVVINKSAGPRWVSACQASQSAAAVQLFEVVAVDAALQDIIEREVVDGHDALALSHIVVEPWGHPNSEDFNFQTSIRNKDEEIETHKLYINTYYNT